MNKIGMKIFVNALTVFRCLFPFVMPFLINKITAGTFLAIVAGLYVTDWLDGFLSRKCHVQTLFGSMMDTLADKVLCIVLLFCIKSMHWALFTILIGEVIIGAMNLLGTVGGASVSSIMIGKVKMWALALATLTGYLYYYQYCDAIWALISGVIVLVMQLFVIIGYGRKMTNQEIKSEKATWKKGKELIHALFDTDYYLSTKEESILTKLTIHS